MKNTLKLILITFSLLSGLALNAISCEAIEVDAAGCQVVLVNDIHVDNKVNKKGPKQRQMFLDNIVQMNQEAKEQSKQPVHLIVEDMLAYEGPHQITKDYIANESLTAREKARQNPVREKSVRNEEKDSLEQVISVLENLTHDSRALGIDCFNAECRQVKWVSRNESFITGEEIAREFEYNTQQIMQDLEQIKLEAERNDVARAVYVECCKVMEFNRLNSQNSIELLRRSPRSLKQLEADNNAEFARVYNQLHDRYLLDARILIQWYKNRLKDTTVIVAGQVHTENVLKVFETLGYKIKRHGMKFPYNNDGLNQSVNNCINFDNLFKDLRKQDNPWSVIRATFNVFVDAIRKLVA